MTLIEIRQNGRILGRCDARCYQGNCLNAGRCDCVCEGLNHGIGLEAAIGNVPRIVKEWREYPGGVPGGGSADATGAVRLVAYGAN